MNSATIQHFLKAAKQDLATVSPEDKVFYALTLMANRNISAVPVVKNQQIVGIFSERDYARKVVLQGKSSKETLVEEIMTPQVLTVTTEQKVSECMEIMTNKRVRHLPIVDENNKIIGIISIGDVVKTVMEQQRSLIEDLQRFIAG